MPTADEWAEQVDYVIKTVGADHVAIGLDMVGGRSSVPQNAGGYAESDDFMHWTYPRMLLTPERSDDECGAWLSL